MNLLIFILLLFGTQEKNRIDEYLSMRLKEYERFEYEVLRIPAGNFSVDPNGRFFVSSGLAFVPIKVSDGSGVVNSYLTLKVKLFLRILAAKKDIKRGEKISSEDFYERSADVSGYKMKVFSNETELSGCFSKVEIEKDKVLMEYMVGSSPAVKRGETLTAFREYGNIHITIAAKAKEDGGIGEIIKIQTSDNKTYRAEVLDSTLVKIRE